MKKNSKVIKITTIDKEGNPIEVIIKPALSADPGLTKVTQEYEIINKHKIQYH